MTPREAADRLFDRVMRAESAGDMDEVLSFTPMAIQAYGRVDDLDADARYHLGLLHLLLGETDPARTYAEEILAEDASHLFGLFVAAQAARAEGREVEARELYARFLDAYPTEITRDLPEYQAHANVFPTKRAEALEFTR